MLWFHSKPRGRQHKQCDNRNTSGADLMCWLDELKLCCFLPAVALEGPGFLYSAPAAAALAAEVQAEGGILTAEDLTGARVEVTPPLTVQVSC